MKGLNISGSYIKEKDIADAYRRVKSVYLDGKFQTEFKKDNLIGWYDQISPFVFVKRHSNEGEIYMYKHGTRWQVSPDVMSKSCWLFSTRTDKECDEYLRWFERLELRVT